jgi:two-component system, response regulator YesN
MTRIHILIADDEQLERDALELMLTETEAPITCIKAKNGSEAVQIAEQYRPQIIILDIQMPGLTGLEAAEIIRKMLPDAIIVFLTAWGRFDFARKAIHIGAAEYLVKPVDKQKIQEMLTGWIKTISPAEKGRTGEDSAISCDTVKMQQAVTNLQNAILDGNLDQAVAFEQNLLSEIYACYGRTERAAHELYETTLGIMYSINKDVPFLFQDKPETENAQLLESSLARFVTSACSAVCEDRKDKYRRLFSVITAYLNTHFSQPLSAEETARQFNLHPAYFTRLFPQYCGKTFVDYLTSVRMQTALNELSAGKTIRETAALTGFSDTNYFSRVFRKYYGQGPREFTLIQQETRKK